MNLSICITTFQNRQGRAEMWKCQSPYLYYKGKGRGVSHGCLAVFVIIRSEVACTSYHYDDYYSQASLPQDGPASHPPEQRLGNLLILDGMHHPYQTGAGLT